MKQRTNGWSPLGDTFRPSRAGQPLTSCEVQLTLHDFLMIKHLMHSYYNIERSADETFVLRKPIFMEDCCVEKTPDIVLEMRARENKARKAASSFIDTVTARIKKRKSFSSSKKSTSGLKLKSSGLTFGQMTSVRSIFGAISPQNSNDVVGGTLCYKCEDVLNGRGRRCEICETPYCATCKKEMMRKCAPKSWQCKSCPKRRSSLLDREDNSFRVGGFGSPHNFTRVSAEHLRRRVSIRANHVLAKGYLKKLSHGLLTSLFSPSWKDRFFILTANHLKWWDRSEQYKAGSRCRNQIKLEGANLQEVESGEGDDKNLFRFRLSNEEKTVNLGASSADERQGWMTVIAEVLDRGKCDRD